MAKKERIRLSPREEVLKRYGKWLFQPDPPIQAELLEVPFLLTELVDEIHSNFFPTIVKPLACFARSKYFALIKKNCQIQPEVPQIVLNGVSNNRSVPIELVKFILKHEFIHMVIDAQKIDGRVIDHPPAFWEKEKEISPEYPYMVDYIEHHFSAGAVLVPEDEYNQEFLVLNPRFVKRRRTDTYLPLETFRKYWSYERHRRDEGIIGARL